MAETKEFKAWVKIKTGQAESANAMMGDMMAPRYIKTEELVDGKWVPYRYGGA